MEEKLKESGSRICLGRRDITYEELKAFDRRALIATANDLLTLAKREQRKVQKEDANRSKFLIVNDEDADILAKCVNFCLDHIPNCTVDEVMLAYDKIKEGLHPPLFLIEQQRAMRREILTCRIGFICSTIMAIGLLATGLSTREPLVFFICIVVGLMTRKSAFKSTENL